MCYQIKKQVTNKKVSHSTNLSKVIIEDREELIHVDRYLSAFANLLEPAPPEINWGSHQFSSTALELLPLHVIYPIFTKGVQLECILDSSLQNVIMQCNIWEKLPDAPLMANKKVCLTTANNTKSLTLGLVKDCPIHIGKMTWYLQIQVVENAPFEVLLGQPFFNVTCCTEISSSGGKHHIEIHDPETSTLLLFLIRVCSVSIASHKGKEKATGNFQD